MGGAHRESTERREAQQERPQVQLEAAVNTTGGAALAPPTSLPLFEGLSVAQLAPPACIGDPSGGPSGGPAQVQREPGQGLSRSISSPSVHALASAGTRGAGQSLPHLKTIQRALPEHDLRPIRAYTGGAAAGASRAMGASAYAFGDKVAFVQRNPSLHTAAHEAAHVLQQRAGIQLKGGVGQVGDPYERNADAIADAVVRRQTPPPVLGGRGGSAPGVQRLSAVGDFVTGQRRMMSKGRKGLTGKYTTVGFEFEFATMADGNPFSGLSHVEIAKSPPMPDPKVPFVLETDASNALELVSPPFWLPTFGDQLLPEPDHVEGIIDIFKERLDGLTQSEPTILELKKAMKKDDSIDFALRSVALARENLTPRTEEGLDVEDRKILATSVKKIKLKPISKFGGAGIDAQVNIATDAFGNDLMNQAFIGDRFSDSKEILAFEGLERALVNILYKAAFKPTFGWGRSLRPFAAAIRAVNIVDNTIFNTLKDARTRFRDRADGCYDEDWYYDFVMDTTSEAAIRKIAMIIDSALVRKLKSYNCTPFELSLITDQINACASAAALFIQTTESFLDQASGAKASGYKVGEIDRTLRRIGVLKGNAIRALGRVPHVGSSNGKLRVFLNALARSLSGQLAVHSIDAVRKAQEARLADPDATMGKGDPSFGVHQFMSSRVKDVRGVWAKAPVLDIGLGILSFKDWEKVSELTSSTSVRAEIAGAVADVPIDYRDEEMSLKTLTLTKKSIEPLVLGVVDGIQSYISTKKLTEKSRWKGVHTVKGDDRRKMKVGSSERPDFMSHDKKLMTPRQDTFVPLKHVQMPEVWGGKTRQFVVESRTNPVETLRRIKRFTG